MAKSPEAFRTISEVAELLETPAHVLRFWESRFTQIKPVKRAGGRRYYRPADVALLGGIRKLLHDDGMTIRGVQKVLREKGVHHVGGLVAIALPGTSGNPGYDVETTAIEQVTTADRPIRVEAPAPSEPQQDADAPVAVTGFALESFVAKHGGKGLPMQGQDSARNGALSEHDAPAEEPEPTIGETQISETATESHDEPLAPVPVGTPPEPESREPDMALAGITADPRDEPPEPVPVPLDASVEALEPYPTPAEATAESRDDSAEPAPPLAPARIPQRGQTPEDAVAMVDAAALPRMGASLRRAGPTRLGGAETELAAIYERMRTLRLRLAQDVGTARR